jgi:hypothetical protein
MANPAGNGSAYTARLGTRITGPVNARLRLFALVTQRSLSRTLTETLDRALPTQEQLTAELARQDGGADR